MKKVEKERKIKVLSLVALIVAVLGLTIAFAALSQTLTINGTASVNSAEWDVHFVTFENFCTEEVLGNLDECKNNMSECFQVCKEEVEGGKHVEGTGKIDGTPVVENNEISNLNLSVSKPGDVASYGYQIINMGTINALVDSIEVNGKEYGLLDLCPEGNSPIEMCDWDNDGIVSEEDRQKVAANITLETTFSSIPRESGSNPTGSIIKPGESFTGTISLKYIGTIDLKQYGKLEIEATELPKRNLEFNGLSQKINFVQSN